MIDLSSMLPEILLGSDCMDALKVLPEYDDSMRIKNSTTRLMELSKLYNIYVPSEMSVEIYCKLYLAIIRSLRKKGSLLAVKQQNNNRLAIRGFEHNGIMGGADSFTIIGASGIGKSSAINRAISIISEGAIEFEKLNTSILPCIVVQCPFDSSVKSMLLEILRKIDETLGSNYYTNALKSRATTDMLIGSVSQVCINHICLLIIDEIQNVVNSKNGKVLIGSLTQLINSSGISICMVGTPECIPFFEQSAYLARRALGLKYTEIEYNSYFKEFCTTVFSYQYTQIHTEIDDTIIEWLYEHRSGLISNVVTLIHDAQEIAIINGTEQLDLKVLNEAYQQRLSLLHEYIQPDIIHNPQTSNVNRTPRKKRLTNGTITSSPLVTLRQLADKAKADGIDFLDLIRSEIVVEEVEL